MFLLNYFLRKWFSKGTISYFTWQLLPRFIAMSRASILYHKAYTQVESKFHTYFFAKCYPKTIGISIMLGYHSIKVFLFQKARGNFMKNTTVFAKEHPGRFPRRLRETNNCFQFISFADCVLKEASDFMSCSFRCRDKPFNESRFCHDCIGGLKEHLW